MSTINNPEKEKRPAWHPVAADNARERLRILACERILLYARGLDLDAGAGLELAEESLKRTGENVDLTTALRHMHAILAERGIDKAVAASDGSPLSSFPPVRRSSMVSDSDACRTFLTWLRQSLSGICTGTFTRIFPCKNQKTPQA